MKLYTKAQYTKLVKNFQENAARTADGRMKETDFEPVVKLFTPWGAATWLLTELDPETNVAFALCDLGVGEPELGYVSLDELASVSGPFGLKVERDLHYRANKTIGEYAAEARRERRIVA